MQMINNTKYDTYDHKHIRVAPLEDKLAHVFREMTKQTGICLFDLELNESEMST